MSSSHSSTCRINQVADYLKCGRKLGQIGFRGAVALDGGMEAWRDAGYAVTVGQEP